jgi:hypothetical protein
MAELEVIDLLTGNNGNARESNQHESHTTSRDAGRTPESHWLLFPFVISIRSHLPDVGTTLGPRWPYSSGRVSLGSFRPASIAQFPSGVCTSSDAGPHEPCRPGGRAVTLTPSPATISDLVVAVRH